MFLNLRRLEVKVWAEHPPEAEQRDASESRQFFSHIVTALSPSDRFRFRDEDQVNQNHMVLLTLYWSDSELRAVEVQPSPLAATPVKQV